MRSRVLQGSANSVVSKFILFVSIALAVSFMLTHLITAQSTQTIMTDPPAATPVVDAVPPSSGSADEIVPASGRELDAADQHNYGRSGRRHSAVVDGWYGFGASYPAPRTGTSSRRITPVATSTEPGPRRHLCKAAHSPLYFGSVVLADGRLVVVGGEYNGSGVVAQSKQISPIFTIQRQTPGQRCPRRRSPRWATAK